jgi:hypothetical protein
MMMKVVMYIPREPITPGLRLQDKLLSSFGGVTVVQGVGAWTNQRGEVIQEGVNVITVFAEDRASNRDAIDSVATSYMREAYQESVLYEINGVPSFITNERK